MIRVGRLLATRSATLEAAECTPNAMNGRAVEKSKRIAGRNRTAAWIQPALRVQSTSCWATRLQAPQPESAAPTAATEETRVATLSEAAKTVKRRSRVMRALATARLPPNGRTGVSAISTQVSCGVENIRL